MAGNSLLFVSDRESFIIKSIIKTLESHGQECLFSTLDMDKIMALKDRMGTVVYLYIDDKNDIDPVVCNYLRDLCLDNDYELFLIGYKDDIAELKESVFKTGVTGEFFRPVNAGQLSEEILKEADKEATIGHKKHILVVDDSGTMLTTIKTWLEDKYRVTPVNSAMNAISFLTKEKPDLILLDYEMPVCSGPKFLAMMRTDIDCGDIPVIFLPGRDDAESVKSVLSLKPAGYLLKSLPKETIVSDIDAFFAKQKLH